MAASASVQSSGVVPGLTLKAWVLFKGSDGSIIKQSGVSGVTRSAAGTYQFTLSTPLGNANCVIDTRINGSGTASTGCSAQVYTPTGSTFNVGTYSGSTATDLGAVYVAVYA